MSRLDTIKALTVKYDWVSYYAGGGDNDHDGTPDRADLDDGNGVDCSGWVWASCREAWAPAAPPFPLSSTSGYSFMAKERGWIVPLSAAQPGDILIHASNGDPYNSDGPVGHTGILVERAGSSFRTSESAGSGNGVGFYVRSQAFWLLAIRVPGMTTEQTVPPISPDDLAKLVRALEELDVEHGMVVDTVIAAGNRRIQLDRWGGLHTANAPEVVGTGYWPGKDVARRIVLMPECLTSAGERLRGYVQDLDGALFPFAERGVALPAQRASACYYPGGKVVSFDER